MRVLRTEYIIMLNIQNDFDYSRLQSYSVTNIIITSPKAIAVFVVIISLGYSRFYVPQIFRFEPKEFAHARRRHYFPCYAILHLKSYFFDS